MKNQNKLACQGTSPPDKRKRPKGRLRLKASVKFESDTEKEVAIAINVGLAHRSEVVVMKSEWPRGCFVNAFIRSKHAVKT